MPKRIETRRQMLSEYWDWSINEPGFPEGGNKLLDTRYLRPLEGPFYHGTSAKLEPGEIVKPSQSYDLWYPQTRWNNWGGLSENRERAERNEEGYRKQKYAPSPEQTKSIYEKDFPKQEYAFATKNMDVAKYFAQEQANPGEDAYIYEVEPIIPDHHYDPLDSFYPQDRENRERGDYPGWGANDEANMSFRSPTGWRVIRLVDVV